MNITATGHWPITEMVKEVHEVNTLNGWFEDDRSPGMTSALLNSEVAEMLEAYRVWGFGAYSVCMECQERRTLADWPIGPHGWVCHGLLLKPEGWGSELADVFIRWCDTLFRSEQVNDYNYFEGIRAVPGLLTTIDDPGKMCHWLHVYSSHLYWSRFNLEQLLAAIYSVADATDVNLRAEYDLKIAHNRTRGHKHGGKLA